MNYSYKEKAFIITINEVISFVILGDYRIIFYLCDISSADYEEK